MRRLTTLFPSEFLEEHAEELGVVERDGKLQIPILVWSLVFGFAAGESRTLAGFRRSYNSTADEPISPGGFYHRLTPSLATYLSDLVEAALDEVAVPDAVDADIERFADNGF
jgi:putative transposase